ncbi:hypothetical protein HU200_047670 [Digitaria exilis]|uniref:Uncharacterized protein n=1 Tax=Digitaria exilis TaxID=1010633 RepID=A0A835EBJ3_9POAL|nr:hypothetical protein HU200_047670 [Digitaria exilis]
MPTYGEISDYRYRLIDYVGGGFALCASSGSAFHFTKGFRSSPNGGRLAGGARAVRTNVPRFAGRGGAFLAVFWAVESGMCLARDWREDHWNSIAAGAATFGLGNARRGAPAATLFALLGAASFAGLAGAWWTLDLWNSIRVDHVSPPLVAINSCPTDQGAQTVGSIEYR